MALSLKSFEVVGKITETKTPSHFGAYLNFIHGKT